jgi:hypothetical protein
VQAQGSSPWTHGEVLTISSNGNDAAGFVIDKLSGTARIPNRNETSRTLVLTGIAAVPLSIFSIDVEDWFNLSGTGLEPPPAEWARLESRVEANFRVLLELLAEGGGTATCFFVGYFAKRFPHLVREAAAVGHEIASHSYFHRLEPLAK